MADVAAAIKLLKDRYPAATVGSESYVHIIMPMFVQW